MLFANKINKLRTIALGLIFLGIGVMYLGFLWPKAMVFFFILGLIVMFSCTGIYFWAGMLSSQAEQVKCPSCGKITKMLGMIDHCMFCSTPLSLDPRHAPKHDEQPSAGQNPPSEQNQNKVTH